MRAPETGPAELRRARARRSTRWPRTSSSSSTPAASSSPGRATTCARRSRTCRRCSRRSRTASPSPSDYLPALREQVRALTRLVDDLFELARIDAGALTLELRDAPARPASSSRASAGVEAEARAAARHARRRRRRATPSRALRARQGRARAAQPAHERAPAHAVRRLGRRARRAAMPTRCASTVEDTGEGLDAEARAADVRALLARRPGPLAARRRASGSRSRAASSRRTAAGSGPRTARAAARASPSRCRPRSLARSTRGVAAVRVTDDDPRGGATGCSAPGGRPADPPPEHPYTVVHRDGYDIGFFAGGYERAESRAATVRPRERGRRQDPSRPAGPRASRRDGDLGHVGERRRDAHLHRPRRVARPAQEGEARGGDVLGRLRRGGQRDGASRHLRVQRRSRCLVRLPPHRCCRADPGRPPARRIAPDHAAEAGHERILLAPLHRPRLRRPGRDRLQPRDRERQARGGHRTRTRVAPTRSTPRSTSGRSATSSRSASS